jgi:WD40 repeat protein
MLWCLYTSSSSSSSTFPIVVGGDVGVVFFFRVVLGSAERTKGVYGKRYKIQPLLCAIEASVSSSLVNDTTTVDNNNNLDIKSSTIKVMLCGTVTGYIYLFYESRVVNRIAAHDAPINALSSANKNIVTAGKDGKVKLWSYDLKLLHAFNINSFLPRPYHLSCHAIVGNKEGTRICVGMKGGEIFEISLQSHSYMLLFESHSRGELFALDINPMNADEYVTCSDDGVVMVWSISRKYCLRKVRVESASRAIAWSLDGELIVVGFGSPIVATDLTVKDGEIEEDDEELEYEEDHKSY